MDCRLGGLGLRGVVRRVDCGRMRKSGRASNPAVTLGFAVVSGDFAKLAPYVLAQLLGAITGATLVWLHYLPHWKETPDPSLKLACYSTGPAIRNLVADSSRRWSRHLFWSSLQAQFRRRFPQQVFRLDSGLTWWRAWCGVSDCRSAVQPGMPLTRPGIWGRVLHTRSCPLLQPSDWSYALVPVISPLVGGCMAGVAIRFMRF